jgi:acyl-activating enzyme 14
MPPLDQSDHICAALQQYADRDVPRALVDVVDSTDAADTATSGAHLVGAVAALGRALPLAPGDRCALLGETSSAYLIGLLAVVDAGAIACPLNWRWSAEELAGALAAVAPRVVLVDPHLLPLLERALGTDQQQHPAVFVLARDESDSVALRAAARAGTTTTAALAAALDRTASRLNLQLRFAPSSCGPSVQSNDDSNSNTTTKNQSPDALCVFTSGTTAAPKPARLSHGALCHQSRAKLAIVGYSADDVYLHLAPLFHVGGISSAHAALAAGARHALLPRFSAASAVGAIERLGVTALIAVPAMLSDLLDAAEARGRLTSLKSSPLVSLRRVLLGAGAASPSLLERCLRALHPRAVLMGAYGMTEGCSSLTFADLRCPLPSPPADVVGGGDAGGGALVCVGRAAPGVELAIAAVAEASAPALLRRAPQGVVGEVLTRGPNLMSGYYLPQVDRDAARKADAGAFVRLADDKSDDGRPLWFRTGDAGVLVVSSPSDPPFLYLAGRLKECIRSGGENVFAPEVEAALCLHPAVEHAAAAGLPDARLGEAVAAAVVLRPGWVWRGGADAMFVEMEGKGEAKRVSAAALRAFCVAPRVGGGGTGAGLSRFKAPRAVTPLNELPRDPLTGKIARKRLRAALLRALGRGEDGEGPDGGGGAGGVGAPSERPRSRL